MSMSKPTTVPSGAGLGERRIGALDADAQGNGRRSGHQGDDGREGNRDATHRVPQPWVFRHSSPVPPQFKGAVSRVHSDWRRWPGRLPGRAAFSSQSPTKPATERKHMRSKTSGAGIQNAAATWPRRVRRKSQRAERRGGEVDRGALGQDLARAGALEAEEDARVGDVDGQVMGAVERAREGRCGRGPCPVRDEEHQFVGGHPRRGVRRRPAPPGAPPASAQPVASATAAARTGSARSPRRVTMPGLAVRKADGRVGAGRRHQTFCRVPSGSRKTGSTTVARTVRPCPTGKLRISPLRPAPPATSAMAIERPSVGEK